MKGNAIAGRSFPGFAALEAHLERWTRGVADLRIHGTTGGAPAIRVARDEAGRLKPVDGIGPFPAARDLVRRVGADCGVEVDGSACAVPWRLTGERVRVTVSGGAVRIPHGGREAAVHAAGPVRRARVVDPAHFVGVAGADGAPVRVGVADVPVAPPSPELLRPPAGYDAAAGGAW